MTKQIHITNSKELLPGASCVLTSEEYELLLSWKIRGGESFTFTDEKGDYFRGRFVGIVNDRPSVKVIEKYDSPVESNIRITLFQCLPARERMELILEKAVELGVSRIITFRSEKSISIEERDNKQKKSHKWPLVLMKAAKQCRRALIPELEYFDSFCNALNKVNVDSGKILLSEKRGYKSFRETLLTLSGFKDINVMIGPEGSFSNYEIDMAVKAGFIPVNIGGRILRTETAAIAAISIIQYELGDLS